MSQLVRTRDIVQRYKRHSIVLHEWQEENVKFIEDNKFVLIGDEMGLGKTFSALAAVKKNKLYPCLILCPKSLKINWKREIRRIDHFSSIEILEGTKQKGVIKKPEEINGRFGKNYTIIQYPQGQNAYDFINNFPEARSIILDEVHYLKNYKAKRVIAVQKYIREKSNASHVIGLSGTPILTKDPSEIFTEANVLHSNIDSSGNVPQNQYDGSGGLLSYNEFFDNFTFKTYFNERMTGYGITPEKAVELNALLRKRGIMIRHTVDLLKDKLPAISKIPKVFPRPAKYYQELNRLEAQFGHIKIAQLTLIRKWLAEEKVDDTVEYVEGIIDQSVDDKVIVFGNYKAATTRLGDEFGVVAITGDTKSIIDKFQSDRVQPGKLLIMISK